MTSEENANIENDDQAANDAEQATSAQAAEPQATTTETSSEDTAESNSGKGALVRLIALVVIVGGGYIGWQELIQPGELEMLEEARTKLAEGNLLDAEELMRVALQQNPKSFEVQYVLAESLRLQQKYADAVPFYEMVPDNGSFEAINSRTFAGSILLIDSHALSEAEDRFRRALEQDPENAMASEQMTVVCGMSCRFWEQLPFLLKQISSGDFNNLELYLLCRGEEAPLNIAAAEQFRKDAPDDPLPMIAMSYAATKKQNYAEARRLLEMALEKRPELSDARYLLARALLSSTDYAALWKWNEGVSEKDLEHPGIWEIRGEMARLGNQPEAAARCFWESLKIDPTRQSATYSLAQLLNKLGKQLEATTLLGRVDQLESYLQTIEKAKSGKQPVFIEKAAHEAETLGLIWEAFGWSRMALTLESQPEWARQNDMRLGKMLLTMKPQRSTDEANVALSMDLSEYPLPDFSGKPPNSPANNQTTAQAGSVRFVEEALGVGLRFDYENSGNPINEGPMHMFEFTGGGVGVLDYDLDGYPDVFFTQGSSWPPNPGQRNHLDRLFRNIGGEEYVDVMLRSGIRESDFSQGIAVGDFDNDGFPDLLVANIGPDRLYRNNGDGTFSEWTAYANLKMIDWTTSCVIADINRDGNPDVYTVSYLMGDDLFERICKDNAGVERHTCMPSEFAPSQDQVYFSHGEGDFEYTTITHKLIGEQGNGLGIVAADFDGIPGNEIFVANDATPNALHVLDETGTTLTDSALVNGIALNSKGSSEACMGVATADINGDGRLDLYITNFEGESNTLYLSIDDGGYIDATNIAGLHSPSLSFLGFGTQFIDGENDGLPDIVVTNGHVSDFRPSGGQYFMRPQYYKNTGGGRFQESTPESLGKFFEGQYLGRGLARLDWNRDGLTDVVISHLDVPAALLTNTTKDAGNYVSFHLVGTKSSRDAIGTSVTIKVGEKQYYSQLTAGDGYHASNQRCLHFGLGSAEKVDGAEIRWPDGTTQSFNVDGVNQTFVAIEGGDELAPLP